MSLLLWGSYIGCRSQRIQYKLCLLVHKMFVGHAANYIASLLMPASDIPSRSSLRSSINCDSVVPQTSRMIGDRAFSVAAPSAWNRLPTNLKLLHLTASFKSKLKSLMFHAAYTMWTLECATGLNVGGALQVTVVTVTVTPRKSCHTLCGNSNMITTSRTELFVWITELTATYLLLSR